MKAWHFIYTLSLFLVFSSCGQKQNTDASEIGYDFENYQEDIDSLYTENINTQKMNIKIKGYQVINKQFGIPVGTMHIPDSWEIVEKDKVLFESLDRVKVFIESFKSYYFSNDQQVNYLYSQQNNIEIKPVKSLDRLLKEDIIPVVQSQGLKWVNQFSLPELAQFDKRFDSYLYKSIPENKQFQCVVAEFLDKNGIKSMCIIRYYTCYYSDAGGVD